MLDSGEKTDNFDAARKHRWKLNSLLNERDTKLQYLPFPISLRSNPDCEHAHEMTLMGTTFQKFIMNDYLAIILQLN